MAWVGEGWAGRRRLSAVAAPRPPPPPPPPPNLPPQATVGLLVAKTLTNATANPFLSGGAGSYNPVLALDVFLVQASTNTALAHFASLLASLWLIRVINRPSPYVAGKAAA